jgi:hypothetical protein
MKLYKADLKNTMFWEILPDKFKELNEGNEFFTFFYLYSNQKSEIVGVDLNTQKIVPNISVKIYKGAPFSYRLGYFQYPMDSQNTLFYQFLRYHCRNSQKVEVSDLNEYFKALKIQDLEAVNEKYENTLNNNVFKIYNRDNFLNAVNKFLYVSNEVKTNTISIFDSIDTYCKSTFNKSLYGENLVKIVKAVRNPNGGLVPDTNAKLRYMYVGENSTLLKDGKSEYAQSLEVAKDMFRNRFNSNEIFLKTKWFYNSFDNKWRMPIIDKEFKINDLTINNLFMTNNSVFVGEKEKIQNAVYNKNDNAIVSYVNQGYDVPLGDVVSHPTLFKHYPELFNIPTFFLLNDTNDYSFYFSPNPKYIMMFGNPNDMDIRETFIHEIQHAIQDIENYGTGGNLYIADLINSIGGESLKEYLFKKQLAYRLFEKEVKSSENLWFEEYKVSGLQSIDSLKSLNINTKEDFISNLKKIFNVISIIYTSTQNTNGVRVIELFVPYDIILILKELREIHASIRLLNSKLRSQGYTDYEISRMQFQTYEYLSGEIESRNVQQISMIDDVLSDYFAPLTSEAIQKNKVSVIYDELISDEKFPDELKGALERTKNGLYIIHLTEGNSPKTILHEIGHFIHDMIDSQHLNEKYVEKEILKNMGGIDVENNPSIIGEVFVDLLLSYIAKLNLSKEFTEEISENLKYPNVELFKKEFDEIFLTKENTTFDAKMMEYLKYLKELNNLIDYNG